LEDIYTFLVRGSASKLPRGYIWLVPVWFSALGLLVLLAGRELSGTMPLWLSATELGSMVLAGLTLVIVLSTVRRHAFRVSSHGVWLGCRTIRKRPRLRQVHIPWADIAQIRMARTFYGTLVEIGLGSGAQIVRRPGLARQALLLLGVLVLPLGFGRGRPGLTAARANPPRYLVKVCDLTPAELREVFTVVKPPPLAVRVLTKPGPLRYPLPARTRPAIPANPVAAGLVSAGTVSAGTVSAGSLATAEPAPAPVST
jgi:hypothetical protein